MERLEIKVVNRGRHGLPGYATVGSAGMDLRANLDGPIVCVRWIVVWFRRVCICLFLLVLRLRFVLAVVWL